MDVDVLMNPGEESCSHVACIKPYTLRTISTQQVCDIIENIVIHVKNIVVVGIEVEILSRVKLFLQKIRMPRQKDTWFNLQELM